MVLYKELMKAIVFTNSDISIYKLLFLFSKQNVFTDASFCFSENF